MNRLGLFTTVAVLVFAAPSVAATNKPAVHTGNATQVTQTSATLTGSVNPNGLGTTYYFEYGTSAGNYTVRTGPTGAGAGTKSVNAAIGITGLAPATKYHYRLVATNTKGPTRGGDVAFTTQKQPLGFGFGATPNPVSYGGAVQLFGQLTGTGSAGHGVEIQYTAFPYTADWANATTGTLTTDAEGKFTSAVTNLLVNTQFRAITTDKQPVVSAPVLVGVAVNVSLHVSATHFVAGHKIRFSGFVTPIEDGALYYIQRSVKGVWKNVHNGSVRHGSSTVSRYIKTLRTTHSGAYRVVVGVNNQNTSGTSNVVHLHVIHRKHHH